MCAFHAAHHLGRVHVLSPMRVMMYLGMNSSKETEKENSTSLVYSYAMYIKQRFQETAWQLNRIEKRIETQS